MKSGADFWWLSEAREGLVMHRLRSRACATVCVITRGGALLLQVRVGMNERLSKRYDAAVVTRVVKVRPPPPSVVVEHV